MAQSFTNKMMILFCSGSSCELEWDLLSCRRNADLTLLIFLGDYCECDNFSCDRYDGQLCSGPDHGECVCGKCVCASEWDVPGYTACECQASNDTCITPYGEHIHKLCSGHGTCQCGECKCAETEEGQYSGKYCEDCPVS